MLCKNIIFFFCERSSSLNLGVILEIYGFFFISVLQHIQGEIICVDSKMLEFLDDFEEHPNVYQRDKQLILVTDSAKPDAKMVSLISYQFLSAGFVLLEIIFFFLSFFLSVLVDQNPFWPCFFFKKGCSCTNQMKVIHCNTNTVKWLIVIK